MPYIGKSPSAGVRQRYQYTATAGQTTFSGTDLGNLTLTYTDNNFVDVFQNGVLLKGGGTDYTATSGTSVVLATGASVSDVIEIIVYDVFSVGNFFNRTDSDSRYYKHSLGEELILDADADTSITADTDDQIDFKIGGSDKVTIDSSGNVGIGTSSINRKLEISGDNNSGAKANYIRITDTDTTATAANQIGGIEFFSSDSSGGAGISASIETIYAGSGGGGEITFNTNASSGGTLAEAMRIDENGSVLIATTSEVSTGANSGTGVTIQDNGRVSIQADDGVDSSAVPLRIGRLSHDDGDTIVLFSTNGDARGSISVSGGTVSFNAFMGSHITQAVPSDTLEGTVLESTGDLIDSEEEDYEGYVQQKRLTKCKVSDTEDSNNVYGVFQTESKSGLQYASALGSFFVRVHKDETVKLGDLLSSKGDGTAKVQSDDIIRSRTIGKVTSLTKKVTHGDGSYLLPCVLYCG